MTPAFFKHGAARSGPGLDGRTKIVLLVWATVLSAACPGSGYQIVLCISVLVLAAMSGLVSYSAKILLFYGAVLFSQQAAALFLQGPVALVFLSFFMLVQKLFPTIVLGTLLVQTTRVSEFMFSLEWLGLPRELTIAVAVMLRYFPSVKQDLGAIKDAMRMRGLSLSLAGFVKNPLLTVECLYVPVMLSASRLADELSAASAARGIETPGKRTCFSVKGFHGFDLFCVVLFCGLTLLLFVPLSKVTRGVP